MAKTLAVLFGIVFLLVGILGFVPAVTKDEMLLGIFHVNAAHNCVHLLSGVAALLWSRGIRTPATIESLIRQTALDLGSPGKDDTFGYGLIQPRAALFGLGIRK